MNESGFGGSGFFGLWALDPMPSRSVAQSFSLSSKELSMGSLYSICGGDRKWIVSNDFQVNRLYN
jgi:hypothetical protein